MVSVGDYVIASKYGDADPGDPWAVGFLNEIKGDRYFIGDKEVHSFRSGGYRHCKRIPSYIGHWLLQNAKVLENSPPGSVDLFKMIDTERNKNYEDE